MGQLGRASLSSIDFLLPQLREQMEWGVGDRVLLLRVWRACLPVGLSVECPSGLQCGLDRCWLNLWLLLQSRGVTVSWFRLWSEKWASSPRLYPSASAGVAIAMLLEASEPTRVCIAWISASLLSLFRHWCRKCSHLPRVSFWPAISFLLYSVASSGASWGWVLHSHSVKQAPRALCLYPQILSWHGIKHRGVGSGVWLRPHSSRCGAPSPQWPSEVRASVWCSSLDGGSRCSSLHPSAPWESRAWQSQPGFTYGVSVSVWADHSIRRSEAGPPRTADTRRL